MKKRPVARRIISMLLVFCMLFNLLPLSAMAAENQSERAAAEQVAMYMMDLGLVDSQGNLIYDNTFTVEDGTQLANLDELLDWLLDCPDDQLDTLITVDATGKTATAEWIIEAIAIETQMELLTARLNQLASGASLQDEGSRAANAAVSDDVLQAHSLYLVNKVVSQQDSDTMIIRMGVSDSDAEDAAFIKSPNDITIVASLFCDFLVAGSYDSFDVSADSNVEFIANNTNCNEFTLAKGAEYVEVKIDLAKMRNAITGSNPAKDKSGKVYNAGLWGGCVPVLFQSRIESGAKQQAKQYEFAIAAYAERSDAVVLLDGSQADNDYAVRFKVAQDGSTTFYAKLTLSNVTEYKDPTDNDKVYYKFTIPQLKGKLSNVDGAEVESLSDGLNAIYALISDQAEQNRELPTVTIEAAAIVAESGSGSGSFSGSGDDTARLYYKPQGGDNIEPLNGNYNSLSDSANTTILQKIAAYCNNATKYDSSNSDMKTLYEDMATKNKRKYAYYNNLELQTQLSSGNVEPITTLYVAKDWIKNGTSSMDKKPEYFCLWGTIKCEDTTQPSVAEYATAGYYWVDEMPVNRYYQAGDVIPVTVIFDEPVVDDFQLVYENGTTESRLGSSHPYNKVYGSVKVEADDSLGNSRDISRHRSFYYTVQPGDTGISILGVRSPYEDDSADVAGNALTTSAVVDNDYFRFDSAIKLGDGYVQELMYTDAIDCVSVVQDADDPTKATVKVALKSGEMYKNLMANYEDGSLQAVLDWDHSTALAGVTKYPLKLAEENGSLLLTCDLTLDDNDSGKTRTVELVYTDDNDNLQLYWGVYGQLTQTGVTYADSGSYTISVLGDWPSGKAGTIYAADMTTPTLQYTEGTGYTYKGRNETLSWVAEPTGVVDIVQTDKGCSLVAKAAGSANIYLQSDNGGKKTTVASNKIVVKVVEGATPTLMIPTNANTLTVRSGEKLQVPFYSNLSKHEGDGKITAKLYKGAAVPTDATQPYKTYELERAATVVEIPAGVLTDVSTGGAPAYTLEISASALVDGEAKPLHTEAYIVVNSQPAEVTMTGLEQTMFAHSESKTIKWSIANFNTGDVEKRGFSFVIEKNGESYYSDTNVQESGSYKLNPAKPDGLKDTYVVMLKAKNGTDPSWSVASSTLTVYNKDALKLMVGGKEADGKLTLQTKVAQTETSTAPTVTSYAGAEFNGLTDANAIAKLRAELSLMETVSVNYQAHNWSLLYDTFSWKSENVATGQTDGDIENAKSMEQVVSINYRQSSYYEPIENFSYAYYIPETVMMLCGLRDGSAKITATHKSVTELSATLDVDVNRLQNKLYLFQFTPAVATTLSYTDGKGNEHTVTSNADGSLALWEPNGIDGELRLASVSYGADSKGADYRSTVNSLSLRSGEGNGINRELYPLNAIELTRGAVAQFTLLDENGSPLKNKNITLRGGVYRNPENATKRDDAYCADAKFAVNQGDTASLPGTVDMTFTTDANGVVTIYMDSSQFKSKLEDSTAAISDNFRFIFELRVDGYNPEIVVCESGQTYRDAIRSGNNLLTLTKSTGERPLVVVQTVDYYTGRDIDVREHTGVVGPSPDYPAVEMQTQLMLWGVGADVDDTTYKFDVRTQQSAVTLPNQTHRTAREVSYPFSSIPLVENAVVIKSDSFANLDASKRIPAELALYDGAGALSRTVALPFGLADVSAIDKVSTDQSLISLMANLIVFGTPEYSVDDDKSKSDVGRTLNGAADQLIGALDSLAGQRAKMGLVRTILMPTADPTIFSAYIWTGYDTTEMADLRYDEHGIYMEPTHIFQSEDQMCGTFFGQYTASDFRAMSDGTYQEKLQEDNTPIAKRLYGDGKVMQGWMTAEIVYNFDKGKWQIVGTGGGFTFGKQLEVGGRAKQRFKPFPYNYKITVRGGMVVSVEMAVRYAEQLGQEWKDETARAVNDFLTTLRIQAYLEGYAGLGIDKGLVATVGVYGSVELNNENRFLNRSYLADKSKRSLKGSFVQLDGEIGVRETFGIGPATVEWTWFSYKLGDQWRFKQWNEIDSYWQEASSGYSTGWLNGGTGTQSLQADYGDQIAIAAGSSGVKIQSRDYLLDGDRKWLGGSSVATLSLDKANRLENVQTNAYPFSRPLVADDGSILVYLSDADSADVEAVEVRFSLMGDEPGKVYGAGTRIADPADFAGYGDSALDFDGNADHAAAVWLREATTLNLKPGTELNESQQLALVNGLEVVAAIWDGKAEKWTTTRLTENGMQEMSPIIAVNADGDAIAAWREVQSSWETGDEGVLEAMDFSNSRILYKLYDHENGWRENTYTLYNGTAGAVKGMSVEMIGDTAVVAMALDDSTPVDDTAAINDTDNTNDTDTDNTDNADISRSEIYYAVVDTAADDVEAATRTIRATTNDYLDEDPQLAAIDASGTENDYFVLGWHSMQTESSVEQNDVSLRVLKTDGTPVSILPETLSNMVSTESFGGQFTFVKGANALDELSLLWNDVKAGGENNDVIRAIKFGQYDGEYAASAPIEVAALAKNNSLTHMDAYATDTEAVYAMLQVTEYDLNDTQAVAVTVEDESGNQTPATVNVPKETSKLMSATGNYADAVAVTGTNVDFNTLSTNAQVPVTFTVENQGLHAIKQLTLTVNDASDTGAKQTLDVNLLPGQSQVVSLVVTTGASIADMDYTLVAQFAGENDSITKTISGKLYLDYPDVGISGLQVLTEQGGVREFIATMYNQAAASLATADGSRRVVLGVYSDPSCTAGIDGKYFTGGVAGKPYEVVISGNDLAVIDADNYAKMLKFDIGSYIKDAAQTEIPDQGLILFVRARVEQKTGANSWTELPEADTMNNQKNVTFDSLLSRSNDEPTTITVELSNAEGKATANVQVQNNSLQARNNGHLLATLVDANGKVLETQNVGLDSLNGEGVLNKELKFGKSGAKVLLSYGEPVADVTTAAVESITVAGLPLSIDSFTEQEGKLTATLDNVARGRYVLTVVPANSAASVTVNGQTAENGIAEIVAGGTYEIVVKSANGEATTSYTLTLNAAPAGGSGGGGHGAAATTPETPITDSEGKTFEDVQPGDWYADDVQYVYTNGLMNGTTESCFEPNGLTTRGMIVTILHRLAGKPEVTAPNPFKDVADGAYWTDAIRWAADAGVVTGYDAVAFGPNDSITREQMAAILWRYAKTQGADVSVGEDTNILSYADATAVSEYAVAAMQWACGAGIINGVTDSTLEPQGKATRAQVAAILHRFCDNVLNLTEAD